MNRQITNLAELDALYEGTVLQDKNGNRVVVGVAHLVLMGGSGAPYSARFALEHFGPFTVVSGFEDRLGRPRPPLISDGAYLDYQTVYGTTGVFKSNACVNAWVVDVKGEPFRWFATFTEAIEYAFSQTTVEEVPA